MADVIESTPVELVNEGQTEKISETAAPEVTEKGDGGNTECDTKAQEKTEDAQSTGVKRKSDDAENEDEEAKKSKTDDNEAENGDNKTAEDDTDGVHNGSEAEKKADGEENNGKTHADDIPEEEIVKKAVDTEETPAAEDVTASS